MTLKKTPTRQEFQRWADENRDLALTVCEARAYAEVTREREDAYTRPIYESFGFVYEGASCELLDKRAGETTLGQPLPYADFFLIHGDGVAPDTKARIAEYYAACDRAHRENGHPDIEQGFSPACVAEHLLIEAQNCLLQSGCDLIGLEDIPCTNDLRKRMLDLLLGACFADGDPRTKARAA